MTLGKRWFNKPCTINYWAPGPVDEHNNATDTYTSVDSFCAFQERSRLETGGEAEVGVSIWFVFLLPDLPVPTSTDTLTVDGVEYHFHGDGWLAVTVQNIPDHIEATVWKAA